MRLFHDEIAGLLNSECKGEPIYYVGLGAHDFQLSFGDVQRIKNFEKVIFCLSGKTYTWKEGPLDAPVWLLINQVPIGFEFKSPETLRMNLASGDFLEFFTSESQYESAHFEFENSEWDVF